jgi:hypothetical protein
LVFVRCSTAFFAGWLSFSTSGFAGEKSRRKNDRVGSLQMKKKSDLSPIKRGIKVALVSNLPTGREVSKISHSKVLFL